ncbi:MAG: transcriptional regulator [Desulfobacterales bacterium]|nr:MAG: transcriptional regulator [Desulfobacterales bacterium]
MIKKDSIVASPLFEGLPNCQLNALAAIAVERTYQRGAAIFFEGDDCSGFYMVNEGKVKVFKVSPAGKEHILHIFGRGELFGEVPVFHGRPFPASAEALVKTRTIFFPKKEFISLVSSNLDIALGMLAVLSLKLRRFTHQIEALSLKEVPARLANFLLYEYRKQGKAEITLDISKGQLASLLGTIPETLSRIFARMNEDGLIEVSGRKITLLDLDGLAMKK